LSFCISTTIYMFSRIEENILGFELI
jgi:hypothetical protein